jgi:hypothetical protein
VHLLYTANTGDQERLRVTISLEAASPLIPYSISCKPVS